jgi:hypothetical protein
MDRVSDFVDSFGHLSCFQGRRKTTTIINNCQKASIGNSTRRTGDVTPISRASRRDRVRHEPHKLTLSCTCHVVNRNPGWFPPGAPGENRREPPIDCARPYPLKHVVSSRKGNINRAGPGPSQHDEKRPLRNLASSPGLMLRSPYPLRNQSVALGRYPLRPHFSFDFRVAKR